MKNNKVLIAVLFLWIGFSVKVAYAKGPVLLAVLGEPQCKDNSPQVIRPLFVKNQDKWVALNTREFANTYLPKRANWIATNENKSIGNLVSVDGGMTTEPEWTYPRDYWHVPELNQDLPEILNTKNAYAGWCEPPKHKPITLLSIANFSNPEHWIQMSATPKEIQSLYPAFKSSFNGNKLCQDMNKPKRYKLNIKDIRVESNLVAKDGSKLIAMKVTKDVYECDSELGDLTSTKWFYMKNTVQYIGTDLTLIDVADYDNNGESEFLFWYSGYNSDGYVLYSNYFKNHTDFKWNYH